MNEIESKKYRKVKVSAWNSQIETGSCIKQAYYPIILIIICSHSYNSLKINKNEKGPIIFSYSTIYWCFYYLFISLFIVFIYKGFYTMFKCY